MDGMEEVDINNEETNGTSEHSVVEPEPQKVDKDDALVDSFVSAISVTPSQSVSESLPAPQVN